MKLTFTMYYILRYEVVLSVVEKHKDQRVTVGGGCYWDKEVMCSVRPDRTTVFDNLIRIFLQATES